MSAEGTRAVPKASGEVGIDNGHPGALETIVVGEDATAKQRDAHGTKIVGADEAVIGLDFSAAQGRTLKVGGSPAHRPGKAQREHADDASRTNAGYACDTIFHRAIEGELRFGRSRLRAGGREK